MAVDNLWSKAFGGGGGGGLLGLLGIGGKGSNATYGIGGFGPTAPPGYANGTDDAPGGWSIVGENGPELKYLEKGAKIYRTVFFLTAALLMFRCQFRLTLAAQTKPVWPAFRRSLRT